MLSVLRLQHSKFMLAFSDWSTRHEPNFSPVRIPREFAGLSD
jgi:hypothetical protein